MQVRDAVATVLTREGVEFVTCFPHNPLIDACASQNIQPIVARSERVMVNIADGFARVAGNNRVGVTMMQDGPGVENAFPGVASAYADSSPILVLPGSAWRHRAHTPPYFSAVENYRGVTKWAAQINVPESAVDLMRRAFVALRHGRTAPVLLELPEDLQRAEYPSREIEYQPVQAHRVGPDPSDVVTAVDLLLRARRPILLAGQGVLRAGASDELLALAEGLRLPVLTTITGKGAFPENHPLALGPAGVTSTAMVDQFLKETDLIFAVGTSLTRGWIFPPLPESVPIVQSTVDDRDLSKDQPIEHAVLGDARLVLRDLHQEVSRRSDSVKESTDPRAMIAALKSAWLEEWMPRLQADETPLNPYRVVWDLRNTLDRSRTIITHDSGSPRDQLSPFYDVPTPGGYIGWGHSTQLGNGLGFAIGAKLAKPEKTVVHVMGDAALGMVGMDLETASRYGLGIVTILLNNSAMGGYESVLPVATERYRVKYLSGDYAAVATALGGWAERVTEPTEIVPSIKRAVAAAESGQPALLEFITCEDNNLSAYW